MNYLLKVDISGIQKYIFDTPSDGAAKELKARSFFVYALTHIAEQYFRDCFPINYRRIYNGGGNLFAIVQSDKNQLKEKTEGFQKHFLLDDVYPHIGYVEYSDKDDFSVKSDELNDKMNREKYKRAFTTTLFSGKTDKELGDFTSNLAKSKGFTITEHSSSDMNYTIEYDAIIVAGYKLKLVNNPPEDVNRNFCDTIINKLPQGIDFDRIALRCASERNTDNKLAALKIDVDKLGNIFKNKSREDYETISGEIERFFSRTIYADILKDEIESMDVYPVFAGGDDCFLIGGWDIILNKAIQINKSFYEFQQGLREKVSTIKESLTISAGIVIVNPKFPMQRLAEESEEALHLAKNAGRNKVCVFGEVLKWQEFEKAEEMAVELKNLIAEKGESRALLERIKSSDIGFRSLQDRVLNRNRIDFPKVYRLKYYLRNAKSSDSRAILGKLFEDYTEALLQDFMADKNKSDKKNLTNPARFPVAARWAELLTKKYNYELDKAIS